MATEKLQVKLELNHKAAYREKPTPDGFTHDWMVTVRGPNGSEISHFVEKVIFYLHESFKKPKRSVKEPPYSIAESGYAGFTLPIDICFRNKDEPKKITFYYDLFLHAQGCPPVNNTRCEKLTFENPTPEFRSKLLKAGAYVLDSNYLAQQENTTESPIPREPSPPLDVKPRKEYETKESKLYSEFRKTSSKPEKNDKYLSDEKFAKKKNTSHDSKKTVPQSSEKESKKIHEAKKPQSSPKVVPKVDSQFTDLFGAPIKSSDMEKSKEKSSKSSKDYKEKKPSSAEKTKHEKDHHPKHTPPSSSSSSKSSKSLDSKKEESKKQFEKTPAHKEKEKDLSSSSKNKDKEKSFTSSSSSKEKSSKDKSTKENDKYKDKYSSDSSFKEKKSEPSKSETASKYKSEKEKSSSDTKNFDKLFDERKSSKSDKSEKSSLDKSEKSHADKYKEKLKKESKEKEFSHKDKKEKSSEKKHSSDKYERSDSRMSEKEKDRSDKKSSKPDEKKSKEKEKSRSRESLVRSTSRDSDISKHSDYKYDNSSSKHDSSKYDSSSHKSSKHNRSATPERYDDKKRSEKKEREEKHRKSSDRSEDHRSDKSVSKSRKESKDEKPHKQSPPKLVKESPKKPMKPMEKLESLFSTGENSDEDPFEDSVSKRPVLSSSDSEDDKSNHSNQYSKLKVKDKPLRKLIKQAHESDSDPESPLSPPPEETKPFVATHSPLKREDTRGFTPSSDRKQSSSSENERRFDSPKKRHGSLVKSPNTPAKRARTPSLDEPPTDPRLKPRSLDNSRPRYPSKDYSDGKPPVDIKDELKVSDTSSSSSSESDNSDNDEAKIDVEKTEEAVEFTEEYLIELVGIQQRLMASRDRDLVQKVVDLVGKTNCYDVDVAFNFDLCSLDRGTVYQIRDLLQCAQ